MAASPRVQVAAAETSMADGSGERIWQELHTRLQDDGVGSGKGACSSLSWSTSPARAPRPRR